MSLTWTSIPATRAIFGYFEDLRRALARLNDFNDRIPEAGRVLLSETYIRSKLIRAARQLPVFKAVIDHIIIQPVEVWSKIKVDDLVKQLEAAKANDASLQSKRHSPSHGSSSSEEQVQTNLFSAKKGKIISKGKTIRKHAPVLLFRKQANAPKLAVSICIHPKPHPNRRPREQHKAPEPRPKALEPQPKPPPNIAPVTAPDVVNNTRGKPASSLASARGARRKDTRKLYASRELLASQSL